jgi:hypothetical protein
VNKTERDRATMGKRRSPRISVKTSHARKYVAVIAAIIMASIASGRITQISREE